jgi:hypothetical protein
MSLREKKGVAIIIAFMAIVILLILGSIFILRSVSEKRTVEREMNSIKAFYIAEAGANDGLEHLDVLINTDLMSTVNDTNPNVFINNVSGYVTATNGIALLINYTKEEGVDQFTFVENDSGTNDDDEAVYSISSTALGSGNYQYTITITENGNPTAVATDMWDFPYKYTITSSGSVSDLTRNIIFEGDFTVRVQRDNFARYALFTDHHTLENGITVWFTDKTNFSGPVHTNERFSFAFNPSGTFDGLATQHLTKARFYDNGARILLNADSNPPNDVPIFNAGFNRGVDELNLESSVSQQDLVEQAWGSPGGASSNGIYVPNDGANCTAGIYVKGNSTIAMSVDGDGNANYSITQGGTTKIITVDYTNNQTTVKTVGGDTETYNGIPDGIDDLGVIIHTDGTVNSLAGTVQRDSRVTISSQSDIVISDNIVYEDYDAGPPPNATGKTNLLGILSWGGDVRIGASCPDNASVHGIVMARNGVFTVDNYASPPARGTLTLLGGVITQFYGAFGTFSGATGEQLSGYGRNFIYDDRMLAGQSPPYFPSMRAFIAFSNDITDKVSWQEGGN